MKKIISFCLWGDNPKYNKGAIENADIALELYPSWICRYYIGKSTPLKTITELSKRENTEIFIMNEEGNWSGMFWRFLPASEPNVELMISRDTDSRLSLRERWAVEEWVKRDKNFHVMRDHPAHATEILGGMWGAKHGILRVMSELISKYPKGEFWQVDQNFLREKVWPLVKDDCFVHDEFFERKGANAIAKKFPTPRLGGVDKEKNPINFVGKPIEIKKKKPRVKKEAPTPPPEPVKKTNLFVYHHLGLGDHLDCNGMIRYFLEKLDYETITVFSKSNYFDMIKFMYRDEPRIKVVKIDKNKEREEVQRVVNGPESSISDLLTIGHGTYHDRDETKNCWELFYDQVNVPYSVRKKYFKLQRDVKEENRVFKKLNPKNKPYIFVHEDKDRGFELNRKHFLKKRLHVIENDISENIFYFIKILKNAQEIHAMESSFKTLIDLYCKQENLFFHDFRGHPLGKRSNKNWKTVKYEGK